jgi:hypothetical protein
MNSTKSLYDSGEFSRRGREIYEREVYPKVGPSEKDSFVAIDIDSGDYEIDRDDFTATERLLARHADAQIWLVRVGQPAAYRIGGGLSHGENG